MNNSNLVSSAPILSIEHDERYGYSPGGWSLYTSKTGHAYLGNSTLLEYILPVDIDAIHTLKAIIWSRKFAYQVSNQSNEEKSIDIDQDDDDDDFESIKSYEKYFLFMSPIYDTKWGDGPNVYGFINKQGIPYFVCGEHLIITDALPFRIAYAMLDKDQHAELDANLDHSNGSLQIRIIQGKMKLCFHIKDSKKEDSLSEFIHASPTKLWGLSGKPIPTVHIQT